MTDAEPVTLVELHRATLERHADRPLFGVRRDGSWIWSTYSQHAAEAERVRGALHSLGVGRDDRVALISNNRPEWASIAYAAFGLGGSIVPMYEPQRPRDWLYILRDSGARVVFVADERIAGHVAAFRPELPLLQHVVSLGGKPTAATIPWSEILDASPYAAIDPDADTIAAVMYTSGTTGDPKGVLLSHRNITSNVVAVRSVIPIGPDDRSLSFLPWAHAFGQIPELHAMMSIGASMGIAQSVDTILADLLDVRPTILVSVPRIFHRIHAGVRRKLADSGAMKRFLFEHAIDNEERRREALDEHVSRPIVQLEHRVFDRLIFKAIRDRFGGRLRYAFSGGAALSHEVAKFIDDLGITVYEGYGLTETSPVVTANRPGARKIGSVGLPIPGVRVEIDTSVGGDDRGGEIVVHGPNVMRGYHRLPRQTEQTLTPDGGLRTGDLGYLDEDGYLYITGRIKELYKLENGRYVAPAPLEEMLKLSPFVANALVYGDGRPFNVAVIVADVPQLLAWAKTQGLPTDDLPALLRRPDVHALYEQELRTRSTDFKAFEHVMRFTLVAEDFTIEAGTLTPTLKTKRAAAVAKHRAELDALYA